MRLRCTFIPQAWIDDYAVRVDAEGERIWEVDVEAKPEWHSHESDALREAWGAPAWVKEWAGPFEVEFEVIKEVTTQHLFAASYWEPDLLSQWITFFWAEDEQHAIEQATDNNGQDALIVVARVPYESTVLSS